MSNIYQKDTWFPSKTGVNLFIGSNGGTVPSRKLAETGVGERERENLVGLRCWTVAHKYKGANLVYSNPYLCCALLDSGAFSHPPYQRWSFVQALAEILEWEIQFNRKMGCSGWIAYAIASYDLLIDEWWDGIKQKVRWSQEAAEWAVETTVAAAKFLMAYQKQLAPRKLVLGCQGVSVEQYQRCVEQVLAVANPDVWIGLGGWCLLGLQQYRYLLPEFHRTLRAVVPLIASAKIEHIHLYGVLWEQAIAPFAWICHEHGISCSTDSKQPITACRATSQIQRKKAGARESYYEDNVRWWQNFMKNISQSNYYRYPDLGFSWEESPLGSWI